MKRAASLLALLAFACAFAAFAQAPAPKAQRLALVIGNAAYRDAPLPNPLNDAADVAKVLEKSGFTVIKRENATLKEMHVALREFGDRLGRESTGLFYFAGHGMQVRGRNYLIPVDADIAREDEVAFSALDLGAVMEKLDSAKNPVNIVVLDACRNNPFGNRLLPTSKGLAQVDAPPGTLIAFATAPGSTAADGGGRNGLYTQHLVRHIERPGLAIEEVFKAVRADVRKESRSQQVPWESTSLESAFTFRKAPAPAAEKVAAIVPAKAAASTSRSAPASVSAPPAFAAGDSWTYRVINQLDQSERKVTLKVKALKGDEVLYSSGEVSDLVGNFVRTIGVGGRVDEFNPSSQTYVFPLKAGASWDLKGVQTNGERVFDLAVALKVLGEEEVETPLGKMRAVRIEREVRWKQRGTENAGVNHMTYWYNAAVKRYVAQETRNVTAKGKLLQRERRELATYDVK